MRSRLRCQPQIGCHRGVTLRELLSDDLRILQRRHDHHIVAVLPVARRRNAVVLGQLQRVDLSKARNHPIVNSRPRLHMALLDAAYYVSRHGAQTRRQASTRCDLDLSKQGRRAFKRYLVKRMNLYEDCTPPPDDQTYAANALSASEFHCLYDVAIGVARTLSSTQTKEQLRDRWNRCLLARWTEIGLPPPDNAVYDALLVGAESPLVECPDPSQPAFGRQEHLADSGGSLRFCWREPSHGVDRG